MCGKRTITDTTLSVDHADDIGDIDHVTLQRRTRQGVARGSIIIDGVDHADDTGDIDHVTCEHAAILVTPNALSSH